MYLNEHWAGKIREMVDKKLPVIKITQILKNNGKFREATKLPAAIITRRFVEETLIPEALNKKMKT